MYLLEALFGRYDTLEKAAELFPGATLIRFPQGIGMIPVDGFLLREIEIKYQGGTKVIHPEWEEFSPSLHPAFERLIKGLEELATELSRDGMVAYVEATFAANRGGHATMIWKNGRRTGPRGHDISEVLKQMGVKSLPGMDEFDTLGLGRYRSTRKWIENRDKMQ